MMYLTGTTNASLERDQRLAKRVGLLIQPRNAYHKRLDRYAVWAADNGAYSGEPFDPKAFRKLLARRALREHAASCLFVAAPDVLKVKADGTVRGDAVGTLRQFPAWASEIHAVGLPVALVAQNGLERMLDQVPWELVNTLFIGGSTEWKVSQQAWRCIAAAKERGKRTHVGRVNSLRRVRVALRWNVDSVDGTFLRFGAHANMDRFLKWLEAADVDAQQVRLPL